MKKLEKGIFGEQENFSILIEITSNNDNKGDNGNEWIKKLNTRNRGRKRSILL